MQLRSDAVKVGVARAPHRSLLKADGLTDEEMKKPLVAVFNSATTLFRATITSIKFAKL